jgi:hypothetical protein
MIDQHVVVDAINKAYDDRVSTLFAEFDADPTEENRTKFGDRMVVAWATRSMALTEMRRRASATAQPAGTQRPPDVRVDEEGRDWNLLDPNVSEYR